MSDELGTGAAPAVSEATSIPAPEPAAPAAERPREREAKDVTKERMNRALRSDQGLLSGSVPKAALADASTETPGDAPASPADEPITLTKAELDRRIQAETDRRAAKAQRDAQTAQKKEQERWLRDNDTAAYAELKRQEDEQESVATKTAAEQSQLVQDATTTFDRMVLDPIFGAVPKADQDQILKDHGHLTGFESRAAIVKASLKALETHYRALGAKDAEEKLRKNPAFLKQQLSTLRGTIAEPEIINGASKGSVGLDMNAWLKAKS